MIVAIIGSHGTGKTTIINAFKAIHPEFLYFLEGVRVQVPAFGFKNPYDLVDKIGIGCFELMNINSWSVIDVKTNPTLDMNKTIFLDRSPIDNYAYYLTLKTERDENLEDILKSMTKYYSSLIDKFVYLPITKDIKLEADAMRSADRNYQLEVDKNILGALEDLKIPKRKIYNVKSLSLDERVNEILRFVI